MGGCWAPGIFGSRYRRGGRTLERGDTVFVGHCGTKGVGKMGRDDFWRRILEFVGGVEVDKTGRCLSGSGDKKRGDDGGQRKRR